MSMSHNHAIRHGTGWYLNTFYTLTHFTVWLFPKSFMTAISLCPFLYIIYGLIEQQLPITLHSHRHSIIWKGSVCYHVNSVCPFLLLMTSKTLLCPLKLNNKYYLRLNKSRSLNLLQHACFSFQHAFNFLNQLSITGPAIYFSEGWL